jgi:O-antigen ligase
VLSLALRRVRRVGLRDLARPALLAVVPLALVVALSALASDHREHAAAATWSFGVAAAALAGFALGLPRLRSLLDWLWWPATVLAGIAVLERLGLADPLPTTFDDSRYAAVSLAGNIGDLTAYLVLPLLLAQAKLIGTLRRPDAHPSTRLTLGARLRAALSGWGWREAAWLAGAVVWLAAVVSIQVLTPVLALVAASATLWLLALPPRRRLLLVAAAALAAIVLAVLTPLGDRLTSEWRELRGGDLNELLTGRLDGWRAGLHVGGEHPILGAGPGSYAAEFAPAKLELIERGVPFFLGHGRLAAFRHAHNEPIEIFAELGVLGLLASAWLLFWIARGALSAPSRGDRALGLAVLVGLLVLGLAHFPLRSALVGYPYVVAGAWLLALAPPLARRATAAPTIPSTERSISPAEPAPAAPPVRAKKGRRRP